MRVEGKDFPKQITQNIQVVHSNSRVDQQKSSRNVANVPTLDNQNRTRTYFSKSSKKKILFFTQYYPMILEDLNYGPFVSILKLEIPQQITEKSKK